MDRSPGFGSTPRYSIALFRLAFATASSQSELTSQRRSNSPAHYAKGTPSGAPSHKGIDCPPTACKHTVSGSISLSFKEYFSPFPHGTSPLSVTGKYLALGGGPPGFLQDFTCPAVLGNKIQGVRNCFVYGAFTLCGQSFQNCSTTTRICNSPMDLRFHPTLPRYPGRTTHAGFNIRAGLGCFPFARRY